MITVRPLLMSTKWLPWYQKSCCHIITSKVERTEINRKELSLNVCSLLCSFFLQSIQQAAPYVSMNRIWFTCPPFCQPLRGTELGTVPSKPKQGSVSKEKGGMSRGKPVVFDLPLSSNMNAKNRSI